MYVRLGEICDFQSGGTPSKNNQKFFDGDIPWITTVALKGLGIDGSDAVNWITEEAIKQSAAKIVPANSIMIGTRVGVGKVAINLVDMSTSQDIVSLIGIDETRWCKEYLCKCLIGKSQYLNSQARGATIKGIKIDTLANLKIPEISIEKQYEVSRIIDKTRIIIEQRKQELMNLNELMKARFVELFGDPRINPNKYPTKMIKDTCIVITGNTPSRKVDEYYGDAIEWIKTDNIVSGLLYPTVASESLSDSGKAVGRTVDAGAILMACIAGSVASIGRVCITDREVAFNQQINAIVPKEYDVRFLHALLQISKDYLVEDINMALKGIMSKSKLEEKEFIVPSMEEQVGFAEFVEQVDKSKLKKLR